MLNDYRLLPSILVGRTTRTNRKIEQTYLNDLLREADPIIFLGTCASPSARLCNLLAAQTGL